MTKQESQLMKGVAILLMLFYHLFNITENVALCDIFLYIDGKPLVQILSKATNPVAFFLILGGYGLYKVNLKGDKHRWSRVLKLYIHYWIILLIFVTIGFSLYPNKYPGNWITIISNLTSFNTTYNGEMWFLFPYVILSLCAPGIFRIMSRFKSWIVVGVTLFIHLCTSFFISRFGAIYLFGNMWIYNFFLVFHLLFSFCLGAVAAREHFFERLKSWADGKKHISLWAIVCVLGLVALNCSFKYNFFYAFLVISCLVLIKYPSWLRLTLCKLGDNSMNMWMIHSWFCYYLFHDFIYSFKYPVLIFLVLVAVSYISSLIVNMIALPIEQRVMSRAEIKEKPIL